MRGIYFRICLRAACVAAVVGTILNLINQGEAILSGGTIVVWKAALTYVVPFLVSAHGSFSATGVSRPRQTPQI